MELPLAKIFHEIRDPIHSFIRLDSDEIKILNSRPFQRLRHIHQLAMTYLVYPGATHRRFEHSLGVMELATRIYDTITAEKNSNYKVKEILPELCTRETRDYWRRVLRIAALCHDMGHLPFSHAAEDELLPESCNHEQLTISFIQSEEIAKILQEMTPPVNPEHVIKLAVGPKELPDVRFTEWETILSEIIVGDAFGADRMDYLLRDSYHAGVAYGRFDHYRLIDTLRILAWDIDDDSTMPALGMEEGGLYSAEALLLARYFMFAQLYCHPVRRIYDIHLKDFLAAWLPGGKFQPSVDYLLNLTDNEVLSAIADASRKVGSAGHEWADRIVSRKHFRVLYKRNPSDVRENPEAAEAIYRAACEEFGKERVRYDKYFQRGSSPDFPVLTHDGRVVPSTLLSKVIQDLPIVAFEYVYVSPEIRESAHVWLKRNRESIIGLEGEV